MNMTSAWFKLKQFIVLEDNMSKKRTLDKMTELEIEANTKEESE